MERTERSSGNPEFLRADLCDVLDRSSCETCAEELRPVPVGSDVWVIKDQKLGS